MRRTNHMHAALPSNAAPALPIFNVADRSEKVSERQLENLLNELVGENLALLSGWLGAVAALGYFILGRFWPDQATPPQLNLLLATCGILFLVRVSGWASRIPASLANPLTALVAGTVLTNLLLAIFVGKTFSPTAFVLLLLLGVAAVLREPRWFVAVLVSSLAGWIAIAWNIGPPKLWAHDGFVLAAGAALAVVIFRSRLREAAHLQRLRFPTGLDSNSQTGLRYEDQFRQFTCATFEPVIICDRGRILEANQIAATLFDFKLEEMIGQPVEHLFPVPLRSTINRSLEFGNFQPTETTGLKRSGGTFPLELNSKALQWRERTLRVVAFRDLSALKGAERSLSQEKQLLEQQYRRQSALANLELALDQPHELRCILRRIIELGLRHLPAGEAWIFLSEPGSERFALSVFSAASACALERFARTDALPKAITVPLDSRESLIVANAEQDVFEIRRLFPRSEIGAYAVLPLLSESAIVGLLFVLDPEARIFKPEDLAFLDSLAGRAAAAVFKLKSFEQLRHANDLLERQRAELKAKNMELTAAKEAAETAVLAKSQFLDNLSHEYRTPLNGILGMAHVLLGSEMGTEQREVVQILQGSAEQLLTMVNDVLDFTQLEAGRLPLLAENFELDRLLVELFDKLSSQASVKGLELRRSLAGDLPTQMRGDAARLRRILDHLITNAIKFTEHGRVELSVVKQEQTNETLTLHFKVADTGIGIAADLRAHLFQPFHQADNSATRRFGGSGLGLALCRRLVELMGGQIGCRGGAGGGSVFWFTARFARR